MGQQLGILHAQHQTLPVLTPAERKAVDRETAEAPQAPAPVGMDIPALITSILKAQVEAQLAQTNAYQYNLLAFQTAMAQA